MSDRVDYGEFYRRVNRLVAGRDTGTLFAKTENNHLVIVAVREGRIVSLACGPKRGHAAIPLIRKMRTADVRLDATAIPFHERELPTTGEILRLLKPETAFKVPPSPAATTGRVPNSPNGGELSHALCKLLTDYVGPAAQLMCEERLSAPGSLGDPAKNDQVIRSLAAEIQDVLEAQEFSKRAHRLLQNAAPRRPEPGAQSSLPAIDLGKLKESLCDLLTDYVGPVAPLICEDKIAALDSGSRQPELKTAIDEIAREIEDHDEAEEFVAKAWKRLRALGG